MTGVQTFALPIWHIDARHPHRRRIQPVEAMFHHRRDDLGADPRERPAFLDGDKAIGLLDRGGDSRDVERAQ